MRGKMYFLGMLILLPVALTGSATAQTWTAVGPVPRWFHSAVLDTSTNRMVIFGGLPSNSTNSNNLNDVWRLSGSTWARVAPSGAAPAARVGHSAVYDSSSDRMIVFGGGLGRSSPCANDVWALTNANGSDGTPDWVQLSTSGTAPAPRMQHGSVYDSATNTMIVYGGQDCFSTVFGDVWVLSNANGVSGTPRWTQLAPTGGGPGLREINGGVTYDPIDNRLIIFGGSRSENGVGTLQNDVWVLSNANGQGGTPNWTQLSVAGTLPAARAFNSTIYDPRSNSLTIFGGQSSSGAVLGDRWVLSNANGVGGAPTWRKLASSASLPSARELHTAVYNPSTNRMTIFGGEITPSTRSPNLGTNDVWILSHANGD